jgi:hypothetical protein
MISVIKSLMDGDESIVSKFQTTQKFWEKFFESADTSTTESLAKALSDAQSDLEMKLDMNRALAKEIMPYTCLAYLYDERDGFEDRALARQVVKAFQKSMVSLEVKSYAEDAQVIFNLKED